MSQYEDLEAINRMISKTHTVSPKAYDLQKDWNEWYADLSWFQKSTSADVAAIARRKRDDFNAANSKKSGKQNAPAALPTATTQSGAALVNFNPSSMPTIKKGSGDKEAVKVWQRIIGATPVDGIFGSGTHTATVAWQTAHGLTADGIVGQKSWTKAAEKKISVPATINQPSSPKPAPALVLADAPAAQMPTIRQGSKEKAAVQTWQRILGVTADGIFGSGTHKATVAWQSARGLKADGVVGPATWAAARNAPVKLQAAGTKPAPTPVKPVAVKPAPTPVKPAAVKPALQPATASTYASPAVVAAQPSTPIKVPSVIDTTPPTVSSGRFDPEKMPTIQAGSTNRAAVEIWQRIIGVPVDGAFGPGTTAATKAWQSKNYLTADGVVGPASWAATEGKIPGVSQATAKKVSDAAVRIAETAKAKASALPLWKKIVFGFLTIGGGAVAITAIRDKDKKRAA